MEKFTHPEQCLFFPASYRQQAIYFEEQMLPPPQTGFNLNWSLTLYGELDIAKLIQALQKIVEYQAVFRTCFQYDHGNLIQVVYPYAPADYHVLDFTQYPEQEHIQQVNMFLQKNTQSLQLHCLPLIKFLILKVKENCHGLIVYTHHIILDGMSRLIWADQLLALYHGQNLPKLPMSYGEYAVWQKGKLESGEWNQHAQYWHAQLQDAKPILNLPTDYAKENSQKIDSNILYHEFTPELTAQIYRVKDQYNISVFRMMYAIFAVFLFRLTKEENLTLGTTFSARVLPEVASLIGPINNIVALKLSLSSDMTFAKFLQQVKQKFIESLEHQIYPYSHIVAQLNPLRSSQEGINSIHFSQMPPIRKFQSGNLLVKDERLFTSSLPIDWLVYCQEYDQSMRLITIYSANLFCNFTIIRLLQQFEYLLRQIIRDQEKKLIEYSLILPEQKIVLPNPEQILSYQTSKSIPELFTDQARKQPKQIAIQDGQESWSYQELDWYTNQFGAWLLDQGIKKNDFVAVLAERNIWLPWAMLGIWKIGASFTILDTNYPAERLIYICQKISAKMLIALPETTIPNELRLYLEQKKDTICYYEWNKGYTNIKKIFSRYPSNLPPNNFSSEQPCYILCTSGTTGLPKAILGKQTPIVHFLDWQKNKFGFTTQDHFSMLSGLAHDPIFRDIFAPLCIGATLYIPPYKKIHSGNLSSWLLQNKITVCHLTPHIADLLVLETRARQFSPLENLRYAFFGGDVLTQKTAQDFQTIAPQARLVNFYGTTETPQGVVYFILDQQTSSTNFTDSSADPSNADSSANPSNAGSSANQTSTTHLTGSADSSSEDQISNTNIPIGKGISDVQILVLNANLHLTAVGELGEIYIRTPYLSCGYYDDPQLTKQKFLQNPYTIQSGLLQGQDFLYKTGDLGRYNQSGDVLLLGRQDQQIKIRGFRVELQEIASTLLQHKDIHSALIRSARDKYRQVYLIAYVILKPQKEKVQEKELREFLLCKLPYYMVPKIFIFLENFTLTENGKIDENALVAIKAKWDETQQHGTVPNHNIQNITLAIPKTIEEKIFLSVCKSVLGISQLSWQDNFFDLGGHSLLVPILAMQLKNKFDINISSIDVFQHTMIESLYQFIRDQIFIRGQMTSPQLNTNAIEPKYIFIPGSSNTSCSFPIFCFSAMLDFGSLFLYIAKKICAHNDIYIFFGPQTNLQNIMYDTSLADLYTASIRKICPKGTCALLGNCYSGYLAYSVGQKLLQEGYSITLLGLIYTRRHPIQSKIMAWCSSFLLWMWRHTKFVPHCLRSLGYAIVVKTYHLITRQNFPHNLRLLQNELGYLWDKKTWPNDLYLFTNMTSLQQDLAEWKTLVRSKIVVEDIQGMHWDTTDDLSNFELMAEKIGKYFA